MNSLDLLLTLPKDGDAEPPKDQEAQALGEIAVFQ